MFSQNVTDADFDEYVRGISWITDDEEAVRILSNILNDRPDRFEYAFTQFAEQYMLRDKVIEFYTQTFEDIYAALPEGIYIHVI